MERSYVAFISYRHTPLDMAVAARLHQLIERYRIPASIDKNRRRLGVAFRDREELPVSGDLGEDIHLALDKSEFLIVVCTPDTPKSLWVQREIEYFRRNHDSGHILAVLAAGEPDTSFPYALTHPDPDNPDFIVEPLAADVRAGSHAGVLRQLKSASLRLFAGILGVPYNNLARREQKRKLRIQAAAFGVTLAVLLGYAGILMNSNMRISAKNTELESANAQISRQNDELENANAQISRQNNELESANAQISRQNDELEAANRTLEAQKIELMKNESDLLADNAAQALENADYLTALTQAVAALPKGAEDPRPYNAKAEGVLLRALDAFRPYETQGITATHTIEQETDILSFILSDDGLRCYTIDHFGMMYCYDLENYTTLWSVRVSLDTSQIGSYFTHLLYSGKNNLLYLSSRFDFGDGHLGTDGIIAIDCDTGNAAWAFTTGLYNTVPVLSADESRLFCQTSRSDLGDAYQCTFLNSKTGEILCSFDMGNEFIDSDSPLPGTFAEDDSSVFIGVKYRMTEEDDLQRTFIRMNLDTQQLEPIHTDTRSFARDFHHMSYRNDTGMFTFACQSDTQNVLSEISRLDTRSGEVLWHIALQSDNNDSITAFLSDILCYEDSEGSYLFLTDRSTLYAIDTNTGAFASETTDSPIISLFPAPSTLAGYACENGQIGMASVSDDYVFLFGYIRCQEMSQVEVSNGTAVLRGDPGALIACTDKENEHILHFSRNHEIPVSAPAQLLAEDVDALTQITDKSYAEVVGEDVCLLREIEDAEVGEGAYRFALIRVDSATGEISETGFTLTDSDIYGTDLQYSNFNALAAMDGSGITIDSGSGDLLFWHADTDSVELLRRPPGLDAPSYSEDSQGAYDAEGAYRQSARRTSDGAVIAAACDNGALNLWIDGKAQPAAELPEDMVWNRIVSITSYRMLLTGGNGYIMLSDLLSDGESINLKRFAFLDSNTGGWTLIDDESQGRADRPAAMANSEPLFAVLNEDSKLRIYNIADAACVQSIDLPLPFNSVASIGFSNDDAFLFAATSTYDSQFLLYRVSDGQLVFRSQDIESLYNTDLSVVVDSASERLYVLVSRYNRGYCIDMRSWTELAEASDLSAYIPATRRALLCSYSDIFLRDVPTTQQLVDAAQATLNEIG